MCDFHITFDCGFARMSSVVFGTSFSYHNDLWIAATGYCMYFYFVLFHLFASNAISPGWWGIGISGAIFMKIMFVGHFGLF